MRDFLLLVATFIIVTVAASAISWPLYTLLSQAPWPELNLGLNLEFHKFAKWFTLLIVAIATLGVLKLRGRLQWSSLGFTPPPLPPLRLLGRGFLLGFIILGAFGVLLHLLDIRVTTPGISPTRVALLFVAGVLPVAFLISLIEEVYFRGLQVGALMRERRIIAAIVLPAMFYSAVHFFNSHGTAAVTDPDWFYGATLLRDAPAQFCAKSGCIGSGVALFLAGVLLALVRAGGGHLLLCIGIHAGWIASIKLSKDLTDYNSYADFAFLADGHDRFVGILAAVWLTVPCMLLILRRKRARI